LNLCDNNRILHFSVCRQAIVCTLFYLLRRAQKWFVFWNRHFSRRNRFLTKHTRAFWKCCCLTEKKIEKSLSPYKSGEVFAWFTNKRIIFTSSPVSVGALGRTAEVEFCRITAYKAICFWMETLLIHSKLISFLLIIWISRFLWLISMKRFEEPYDFTWV